MSNQVYSNEQRKYYALPGMNLYVMSADSDIAAAATDAPNTVPVAGSFPFSSSGSTIENDTSIGTIGTGTFSIIKEGMYSVNLMVRLVNQADAVTADLDYNAYIELTRTGTDFNGAKLDEVMVRDVAAGSTTVGSKYRVFSLKYDGYLKANDVLSFKIYNYCSSITRILQSGTQLIINKIY
jgi:hypothetical protein